ncbi:hypothetical protein Cadr_000018183 [Camelus dromedarius]|uniref:Uncharacterized protein n=1 Tax=Camelus dromedarius TaxID=9838 RepID=A0A5N4D8Q1_CAMDR|nr:hypothetical protein Cadr_000018183 [Camelus dromedarius]
MRTKTRLERGKVRSDLVWHVAGQPLRQHSGIWCSRLGGGASRECRESPRAGAASFLLDPPSVVSVCCGPLSHPWPASALPGSPGLTWFLLFLIFRWDCRQDADFREDPDGEDHHTRGVHSPSCVETSWWC